MGKEKDVHKKMSITKLAYLKLPAHRFFIVAVSKSNHSY